MGSRNLKLSRRAISTVATATILLMLFASVLVLASVGWRGVQSRNVSDLATVSNAWLVSSSVLLLFTALATLSIGKRLRVPFLPLDVQRDLRRLYDVSEFGAGSLGGWTRWNPSIDLSAVKPALELDVLTQRLGPTGTPALGREVGSSRQSHSTSRTVESASKADDTSARPVWKARPYTLGRADTYWSISEILLGDGARWKEIRNRNLGREVEAGVFIQVETTLRAGWTILIPDNEITKKALSQ